MRAGRRSTRSPADGVEPTHQKPRTSISNICLRLNPPLSACFRAILPRSTRSAEVGFVGIRRSTHDRTDLLVLDSHPVPAKLSLRPVIPADHQDGRDLRILLVPAKLSLCPPIGRIAANRSGHRGSTCSATCTPMHGLPGLFSQCTSF